MFSLRLSLSYVGFNLLAFSFAMLCPVIVSVYRGTDPYPFLLSFTITAVFSWILWKSCKARSSSDIIHRKDSLLIVVFTWMGISIFGALPFLFSHVFGPISFGSWVNSIFESTSGFTTTGSSVMHHIESVPHDVLLWRALTQWLGGGGIILLAVAILPFLGVGGLELFQAEAGGGLRDKIQPRVAQTAKTLWMVYIVLTALCFISLVIAGMPIFDALCHSFTTISTAGYSTRNASIGAYGVAAYEWIIIVFMFLGGCNFVLHYKAVTAGPVSYFKDQQFRVYVAILLVSSALIVFFNWQAGGVNVWHKHIRDAIFQVFSIATTTGFGTFDYEQWPYASQMLLAFLLVVGGCAGSTAGGVKVIRLMVMFRHAANEVFRLIHPQSVSVIKVNNQIVEGSALSGIFGFLAFYFLVFLSATFLLSAFGSDFQTSITAVLTCMANTGPGLGDVGPNENFAFLHNGSKITLSLCMILGRLELVTFVALCFPEYWKK